MDLRTSLVKIVVRSASIMIVGILCSNVSLAQGTTVTTLAKSGGKTRRQLVADEMDLQVGQNYTTPPTSPSSAIAVRPETANSCLCAGVWFPTSPSP
jgi:hypothetical protein